MKRAISLMAAMAAIITFSMASTAGAAADPGVKCALAKRAAAAKKLTAKVKCHGKALKKGEAVDAACLSKVENKFLLAWVKAEGRGGCATTDDAEAIEAVVDGWVGTLLAALPAIEFSCTASDAQVCSAFSTVEACTTCVEAGSQDVFNDCVAAVFLGGCSDQFRNAACATGVSAGLCDEVCCP